jgi:hypothetical protein
MGNPEPTFFLREYGSCRFDGLSLCFRPCHSSCAVDTVTENQCVNSTHVGIRPVMLLKSKWDFTDGSYLKAICTTYLLRQQSPLDNCESRQ